MFYSFIAAIGFLLIFEGLLPFAAPRFWRHLVQTMAQRPDRALRITGLISMFIGLVILFLAHRYIV